MRNIVQIIEDDRKGKQLSQAERQIEAAYIQGKYDALRELKIGNNSSTDDVLDKIRAEIDDEAEYAYADFDKYKEDVLHADSDELPDDDFRYGLRRAVEIINKYRVESEE